MSVVFRADDHNPALATAHGRKAADGSPTRLPSERAGADWKSQATPLPVGGRTKTEAKGKARTKRDAELADVTVGSSESAVVAGQLQCNTKFVNESERLMREKELEKKKEEKLETIGTIRNKKDSDVSVRSDSFEDSQRKRRVKKKLKNTKTILKKEIVLERERIGRSRGRREEDSMTGSWFAQRRS